MLNEIKKIFPNAWKRWEEQEDQFLFQQWLSHDLANLSKIHQRTIGSLVARLKKFGLVPLHFNEQQIITFVNKLNNPDLRIYNFLLEKNVTSLFHFTHIDNLSSIFSHGLLGPETLENLKISFKRTDSMRFDEIKNGVSVSISEPNRFMLRRKIYSEQSGLDLVLLQIDPTYLSSFLFFAFPCNAASSKIKLYRSQEVRDFNSKEALEFLFNNIELRNKFNLNQNIPTDPQSEIMIIEDYPIFSIRSIHFQESQDEIKINSIRSQLDNIMSLRSVTIKRNSEYFNDVWQDNESVRQHWNERKWSRSWE